MRVIAARDHPAAAARSVVDGRHRPLWLKAHRCRWSGDHPDNSLAAIAECLAEGVGRAEFDLRMLRDREFALLHDDRVRRSDGSTAPTNEVHSSELLSIDPGAGSRPALLSEAVALLRAAPTGTIFEVDLKDEFLWPWPRIEELGAALDAVRDRVVVAGCADWNLRRLALAAPELPIGFNPAFHLDWVPRGAEEPLSPPRRACGYLDLEAGRERSIRQHLRRRLEEVLALVPGAKELHLRLLAFERMLDDGVDDLSEAVHAAGMLLDVWTLDAGTRDWSDRAARAAMAGVDMITTNTPARLATALAAHGQGDVGRPG